MNTLSNWILSAMLTIVSPEKAQVVSHETLEEVKARYASMASDMAEVISTSDPLFYGSDAEVRTAALVTSVSFFEGGFSKAVDEGKARGDGGNSWCHMQLHIGKGHVVIGTPEMKTWTGKDLIEDRKKCYKAGLEVLRSSMALCSRYKDGDSLSAFTTGRCITNQREARHRWDFAKKILKLNPFIREQSDNDTWNKIKN